MLPEAPEVPVDRYGTRQPSVVSPRTDKLREALETDVMRLWESGLDPTNGPAAMRTVTALAKAARGKSQGQGTDYQLVKDFLDEKIITAIAPKTAQMPKRKKPSIEEATDGLRELIGIGASGYQPAKEHRLDDAGHCFGYAWGSMRRADYLVGPSGLLFEVFVDQLVIVAEEVRFSLGQTALTDDTIDTGRTPLDRIARKQKLTNGIWAQQASSFGRALFEEVQTLCQHGFQSCTGRHKTSITRIAALVQQANRAGTKRVKFADQLETTLLWIADRIPNADHRQGVIEYLGLGAVRDLSLDERRERAGAYFGYENGKRFRNDREGRVIHFIRSQFVVLAGELDYWPDLPDESL